MDEGESKETMRMEEKKENQFIDADRFLDAYEERIEPYEPSPEVLEEFNVITADGNSIPLHPRATRCESIMKESMRGSETQS